MFNASQQSKSSKIPPLVREHSEIAQKETNWNNRFYLEKLPPYSVDQDKNYTTIKGMKQYLRNEDKIDAQLTYEKFGSNQNESVQILISLWDELGVIRTFREAFIVLHNSLDSFMQKEFIANETNYLKKVNELLTKLSNEIGVREKVISNLTNFTKGMTLKTNLDQATIDEVILNFKNLRILSINIVNHFVKVRDVMSYSILCGKHDPEKLVISYNYDKNYLIKMQYDLDFLKETKLVEYFNISEESDPFLISMSETNAPDSEKYPNRHLIKISPEMVNSIKVCQAYIFNDIVFYHQNLIKQFRLKNPVYPFPHETLNKSRLTKDKKVIKSKVEIESIEKPSTNLGSSNPIKEETQQQIQKEEIETKKKHQKNFKDFIMLNEKYKANLDKLPPAKQPDKQTFNSVMQVKKEESLQKNYLGAKPQSKEKVILSGPSKYSSQSTRKEFKPKVGNIDTFKNTEKATPMSGEIPKKTDNDNPIPPEHPIDYTPEPLQVRVVNNIAASGKQIKTNLGDTKRETSEKKNAESINQNTEVHSSEILQVQQVNQQLNITKSKQEIEVKGIDHKPSPTPNHETHSKNFEQSPKNQEKVSKLIEDDEDRNGRNCIKQEPKSISEVKLASEDKVKAFTEDEDFGNQLFDSDKSNTHMKLNELQRKESKHKEVAEVIHSPIDVPVYEKDYFKKEISIVDDYNVDFDNGNEEIADNKDFEPNLSKAENIIADEDFILPENNEKEAVPDDRFNIPKESYSIKEKESKEETLAQPIDVKKSEEDQAIIEFKFFTSSGSELQSIYESLMFLSDHEHIQTFKYRSKVEEYFTGNNPKILRIQKEEEQVGVCIVTYDISVTSIALNLELLICKSEVTLKSIIASLLGFIDKSFISEQISVQIFYHKIGEEYVMNNGVKEAFKSLGFKWANVMNYPNGDRSIKMVKKNLNCAIMKDGVVPPDFFNSISVNHTFSFSLVESDDTVFEPTPNEVYINKFPVLYMLKDLSKYGLLLDNEEYNNINMQLLKELSTKFLTNLNKTADINMLLESTSRLREIVDEKEHCCTLEIKAPFKNIISQKYYVNHQGYIYNRIEVRIPYLNTITEQ